MSTTNLTYGIRPSPSPNNSPPSLREKTALNLGRQLVDNLLTAAAVILSGKTYEQVRFFAELSNLRFMTQKTFYEIQSNLILPTINHFFEDNIGEQREIILDKGIPVTLVGTGYRNDQLSGQGKRGLQEILGQPPTERC